jgi:DnaJ-class molecular chaperone
MARMNSNLIEQVQNLEKANNVVLLDGRDIENPCPTCHGAGYRIKPGQVFLSAVICPTCLGQRSEA